MTICLYLELLCIVHGHFYYFSCYDNCLLLLTALWSCYQELTLYEGTHIDSVYLRYWQRTLADWQHCTPWWYIISRIWSSISSAVALRRSEHSLANSSSSFSAPLRCTVWLHLCELICTFHHIESHWKLLKNGGWYILGSCSVSLH